MASGRQALLEFINKYKDLECLWRVNDKNYRNKFKRLDAMQKLLEIIRKTDPNAHMDSVTKKINALRSSFNKEHSKVKASYRSGAGTDDVHVPKLWYYNLLLFLADRDTDARKPSDIASVLNETSAEKENIEEIEQIEPLACSSQSSSSTYCSQRSNSQQNNDSLKRKIKKSATEVLEKISNRLDNPKYKQKYSAFGEHVAEKLRSMPEGMALYCQKIINDAIFQADCNSLNHSSHIVTDYQHSHFQLPLQPSPTQQPPAQPTQTHELLDQPPSDLQPPSQQPPTQLSPFHEAIDDEEA